MCGRTARRRSERLRLSPPPDSHDTGGSFRDAKACGFLRIPGTPWARAVDPLRTGTSQIFASRRIRWQRCPAQYPPRLAHSGVAAPGFSPTARSLPPPPPSARSLSTFRAGPDHVLPAMISKLCSPDSPLLFRRVTVMSAHHTSSAYSTTRSLSKYGYFRCPLSGMLMRRGRHQIVSIPIFRRSL